MPIGRIETDKLFDQVIVPTLDTVNLQAVRVDRVEHNGDIDDRIMQELRECHLAIADLTFARPSVYFEAGYAQRMVPVIYTVRKDHFDRGAPDTARVHFDLQMRNIIDWRGIDDAKFRVRLANRLRHVLTPIRRQERENAEHGMQRSQFQALSVNNQRYQMKLILREEFARARFRRFTGLVPENGHLSQVQLDLSGVVQYGCKRRGAALSIVEGLVPEGGPIKVLSQAAHYETQFQEKWYKARTAANAFSYSRDIIVCTLEKVTLQDVLRSLPDFTFDPNRQCLAGMPLLFWRITGRFNRSLPVSIHIVDGVKSSQELRVRIRSCLAGIRPRKVNAIHPFP